MTLNTAISDDEDSLSMLLCRRSRINISTEDRRTRSSQPTLWLYYHYVHDYENRPAKKRLLDVDGQSTALYLLRVDLVQDELPCVTSRSLIA
jgi:hypothetical protein